MNKIVYRSAATAVLLQWSIRFIGLISVLVLARLLTPADFGIIGIAMATVAIVEILGAVGLRQALLRIAAPSRDHLDTAWTIQLIVCWSLALLTAAAAPVASWLYADPRLTPVIAVLAVRFIFLGLVNIGVVDFDRNMQFGADMRMRLFSRIVSFFLTIAAAFLFRSYWALVTGLVAQTALLTGASFVMHPYRPRLCLREHAALLGISIWMLIAWTAQTAQTQVERLVAASFGGAHLAGLYSVSKDLSEIFTQEITTALNRVTFVTIASSNAPLDADQARLARIIGCYAIIAAPLGFGLAATSESAVAVLLGAQWEAAAPLLKIVAVYSSFLAVYRMIAAALTAAGHARRAALMSISGALVSAAACSLVGFGWKDAILVAEAALAANLLLTIAGIVDVAGLAKMRASELLLHAARPFAAAALMCVAIRLMPFLFDAPILRLAIRVAIGAPLYALLLAAIWMASGRPAGAESEALSVLRGALVRRRRPLPVS